MSNKYISVRMLREEGEINTTSDPSSRVEFKKGDILDIVDYFAEPMLASGACELADPKEVAKRNAKAEAANESGEEEGEKAINLDELDLAELRKLVKKQKLNIADIGKLKEDELRDAIAKAFEAKAEADPESNKALAGAPENK